jgi:hypothetical protein
MIMPLDDEEESRKADAAEKERQAKEGFAKQEFDKQERELKELSEKQEWERQEFARKDEFHRADAAETEHQAKEFLARQEIERQELFRQHEARVREAVGETEWLNEAIRRQQEQLRQEVDAQRQREIQEQARQQDPPPKEFDVRKPDYADVVRAEALRNAYELKELREEQQKAMQDVLARTDKMGPEEAAAAREEMRKALEKKFKEQQERLAQEQQERGDRLAFLYRGPPSGRDR